MITSDPIFCKYAKIIIPDTKTELFNDHLYVVCTYDEKEKIVNIKSECRYCKHKQSLEIH